MLSNNLAYSAPFYDVCGFWCLAGDMKTAVFVFPFAVLLPILVGYSCHFQF